MIRMMARYFAALFVENTDFGKNGVPYCKYNICYSTI
jgi:hypothetical protein